MVTTDLEIPMQRILCQFSRRLLVETPISERLAFFHLNRLSSLMVIRVEFDIAMTITAYNNL
ncbi:MAG: hypothetical protein OXN89_24010 [Bryobacterales bacterium]|nr:hypothetical protein [Bryobacterales bacterium]